MAVLHVNFPFCYQLQAIAPMNAPDRISALEANSRPATPEIPIISRNQKIHYTSRTGPCAIFHNI
jgi:hypothetical protein